MVEKSTIVNANSWKQKTTKKKSKCNGWGRWVTFRFLLMDFQTISITTKSSQTSLFVFITLIVYLGHEFVVLLDLRCLRAITQSINQSINQPSERSGGSEVRRWICIEEEINQATSKHTYISYNCVKKNSKCNFRSINSNVIIVISSFLSQQNNVLFCHPTKHFSNQKFAKRKQPTKNKPFVECRLKR